jgi:hypothetical protein
MPITKINIVKGVLGFCTLIVVSISIYYAFVSIPKWYHWFRQDRSTTIPLEPLPTTAPVQHDMGVEVDSGVVSDTLPAVAAPAYMPPPRAYTP